MTTIMAIVRWDISLTLNMTYFLHVILSMPSEQTCSLGINAMTIRIKHGRGRASDPARKIFIRFSR
ncbi:MAG: hypothetical protein SO003_01600 [Candidatus Borkfalkiaceae bacterium]|nr:hypothetical protein [Christensenellaceae bacterium]